jgi:SAM-dependent methyltransferase
MNLNLIAQYYDLLFGNLDEDWPLWETVTQTVDGPILELGCGTGRLLLPLAQAGHRLSGLDLSPVALEAAQTKLKAARLGKRVSLHQADMRQFDLPRRDFALAIIPLNTFMHCLTREDQLATLRAVHRHLRPAGQLVLDLFYPDPTMLAEADGRLYFEAETLDELTGHTVQWYWRHELDLAEQLRHMTYILDEIGQDGLVRRVQLPFSLRFFYRYEMEWLLQAASFETETIFGDYGLEPFQSGSPKMIFVAHKQ